MGVPIGMKKVILRIHTCRSKCKDCNSSIQELINFCSRPRIHYSKKLEDFVCHLRKSMTISAIAAFVGLSWDTVKEIEKNNLRKNYKDISLKGVEFLGVDEVHMGKKMGFITIVRDLESGRVLFIGNGKGSEALKPFNRKIKRRAKNIKAICMDMANSYSSWAKEHLPDADIIYDHFHVIKSMNDKLDAERRTTMNLLEEDQKKELKGYRFHFMRNEEDLKPKAANDLKRLRCEFETLGQVSYMKEYLRNIYRMATDENIAKRAFELWCEKAVATGIARLKTMARTITSRLEGLVCYWKYDKLTNASQEGFNNKIRWLTRQAYGYRDLEYLKLKIFDLPKLSVRKEL